VDPLSHPTSEAILAAAQRIVGRRGPEKLTIAAVAREAGVSRPTLYRWYPTKELLLGAIAASATEQFDAGLQALADARPDPADRLDAALRYLVTYLEESTGPDAIRADPAFSLQSLADSLGPHVGSVAGVLGDALDEIPTVASGDLTREQAAEMLLRIAYSHYLVPSSDPEALIGTLRAFTAVQRRPSRARR
jgi:AcrR family transcriptional regulator